MTQNFPPNPEKHPLEIVFTDSLGEMPFILMESKEFVKLIKLLNVNVIYSAFNGKKIQDDFLYLINNGIIFVPHSGDLEALEEYLGVSQEEFPDLFSFLRAKRLGIQNYKIFQEFKESDYFGDERSNFEEYLASKSNAEKE